MRKNKKNVIQEVQENVKYTGGRFILTKKVKRNLYKDTLRDLYKQQLAIVNKECLSSQKREKGGNYYTKSKTERFNEAMSRVAKLLNKELNKRYAKIVGNTESGLGN